MRITYGTNALHNALLGVSIVCSDMYPVLKEGQNAA